VILNSGEAEKCDCQEEEERKKRLKKKIPTKTKKDRSA